MLGMRHELALEEWGAARGRATAHGREGGQNLAPRAHPSPWAAGATHPPTHRPPHLGPRAGVEEGLQVGPQIAHAGAPQQVLLRAAAAAGVDVGLDAGAAPLRQRVGHVPVQLAAQLAPRKAARPDVALRRGGRCVWSACGVVHVEVRQRGGAGSWAAEQQREASPLPSVASTRPAPAQRDLAPALPLSYNFLQACPLDPAPAGS